tara:strand:- start:5385 stop:6095 length:711 start_codon:yes stop_codon:yes gene_type:complete
MSNIYNLDGNTMPLGNNLKKIIKKSGLTTTEVGDLIGRGRETVSRHMNGHTQMSMSDANKYADVLKCEPEDILLEHQPTEVIGTTFDENGLNKVQLFDRDEIKLMDGPLNFPDHYKAVLLPHYFSPDLLSIGVFSGIPIKNKSIDPLSRGFVSIVMYEKNGTRNCVIGKLFETNTAEYRIVRYESFTQRTLRDRNKQKRLNLVEGTAIEDVDVIWATPMISALYHPQNLGITIEDK